MAIAAMSVFAALLAISSCQSSVESQQNSARPGSPLIVPAGFPTPPIPADNRVTWDKFELGRRLFYEKQFSSTNTLACASCHSLAAGFCDTNRVSTGILGRRGARNSPALANIAYDTAFFWDGRAHTLEEQAIGPILNPLELGQDTTVLVAKLTADPKYPALFAKAFGDERVTMSRIAKAIATFERCFLSGGSAYDRYRSGDSNALTISAKRGFSIFTGSKAHCNSCHSGLNFTDNQYHSTGLFSFYVDGGRANVTHLGSDYGKFLTPSLRNVMMTGPYEHNGRFTLDEVLQHYNMGGKHNSTQDTLIRPLDLSDNDLQDLKAFLFSLTDTAFLRRADFKNPFE